MSNNGIFEVLVNEIRKLMAEKLLLDVSSPDEDLLAGGVLDSLSLIQLLVGLEQHFSIRIPLEEMQIEDLRSLRTLAHLVQSHQIRIPLDSAVSEATAARQGR
jgi:acyl carrier protein